MNHPIQMMPDGTFQPVPVVLTKRELFAAFAMQAIVTGVHSDPKMAEVFVRSSRAKCLDEQEYVASDAVKFADALIAALEDME